MYLCCECRVLSGRGLCDGLITRPEESYRLFCVVVCDLESSWMRRPWSDGGLLRKKVTWRGYLVVLISKKANGCIDVRKTWNWD